MFNVSWGWSYTHSRWSVGKHRTHDGPPLCWSSFTGALILVLHGQCVTQVARGDIVMILNWCFILEWCLCAFLLLKYINEVDGLPSSFVTYWCWHIFCAENILWFQYCFWLFTDVDYFSCAKCCYHSRLMFMWFSVSETYQWSVPTSCWFVIYWCWHIFCVENILQFQYCFGLFTDVDYFILLWIIYWCWLFFMCKMLLSFSTDVYVIFCYWNISMKCMHFMLICHLLMLTYFLCGKYSRISTLCKMFLLFLTDVYVIFCYWNISMKWMDFHLHLWLTDVDIFLCGKYSMISILLLIIYWCWLFFMCKMLLSFFTDVYVIFC